MGKKQVAGRAGDVHSPSRKHWTKTELAKISKVNTYQIDEFFVNNGLRPTHSLRGRTGSYRLLYGRDAYKAVMAERKRKDDAKLAAAQVLGAAPAPVVVPVHTEAAEPVVQRHPLASSLARQFNLIQEKLDSILVKIAAIETTLGTMQAQPPTQFDLNLDLDFEPETRRTNGQ